jgi:hypothetical protein
VRSVLVAVLGTLLIGGAVTASAWALQSALLPAPERGDFAALAATTSLERYRLVEGSVRVNGATAVRSRCLNGWFGRRGALLQVGPVARILDLGGHRLVVDGTVHGDPVAYLLLAACPRVLNRTVESLVQNGARVSAARAWFGQPALAVRMTGRNGVRLTLYMTPKRDILLGVGIHGPRAVGLSRVHPLVLTPARLELFEGHR